MDYETFRGSILSEQEKLGEKGLKVRVRRIRKYFLGHRLIHSPEIAVPGIVRHQKGPYMPTGIFLAVRVDSLKGIHSDHS